MATTKIRDIIKRYLYETEKDSVGKLLEKISPIILEQNKVIDTDYKIFICKLQSSTLKYQFELIYNKYTAQMGTLAKDPNKMYESDIYLGIGAKRAYAFDYFKSNSYDYLLQIDSTTLLCNKAHTCSTDHSKTELISTSCIYRSFIGNPPDPSNITYFKLKKDRSEIVYLIYKFSNENII